MLLIIVAVGCICLQCAVHELVVGSLPAGRSAWAENRLCLPAALYSVWADCRFLVACSVRGMGLL